MTVRDDDVREQVMQAGGRPLRVAIRPGTGTGPPLLLPVFSSPDGGSSALRTG
jgi:hypothetical protein